MKYRLALYHHKAGAFQKKRGEEERGPSRKMVRRLKGIRYENRNTWTNYKKDLQHTGYRRRLALSDLEKQQTLSHFKGPLIILD